MTHNCYISIPLHRLNKLQKTSNCHHSRNCWQFRTQITTPKGCCKASRETEIFLKSESVSQHQPLLLLQFGKTTAFHFDSFHTTTADFKATVNIQGWLCCLQQINCIAAGFFFLVHDYLTEKDGLKTLPPSVGKHDIYSSRYFC